ncbi:MULTISPECIES: DsbA family protein [Furfurilactobacillus]|uniref:DsbA family protein n=1 Tax=Furfurilactobacillus rossiae TaxID=231049 RepID=A0A7C9MJC5_9LACO|nr:DsbA family protein [Furfurilactobacillus milii]
MLEIYLFVNPLGTNCYDCEKQINQISAQTKRKLQIQFVPMLNLQTISDTFHRMAADHPELDRNTLAEQMYQIILDYKAASFQGKRLGRQYFLRLQEHILVNHEAYTEELGITVAHELALDTAMFIDDRRSKLAEDAFGADQRLVSEMGIEHPSQTVIFDVEDFDCGLLMEHFDYDTLLEISEHTINNKLTTLPQAIKQNHDKVNLRIL